MLQPKALIHYIYNYLLKVKSALKYLDICTTWFSESNQILLNILYVYHIFDTFYSV